MITAVIPTRAGSERVKNKNTKSFADTNLLQIKIDTMKKLKSMGFIEDILVNTNCVESKNIANSNGVTVVDRDEYLASSDCPITDYWKEVLTNGVKTKHSMLCQCTSPLITLGSYQKCINEYNEKSLMTIEYLKDYIWKNNEALNYDYPNHPKSQNLSKEFFKITFGIVIIDKEEYLKYNNLVTPNTNFISIPREESIDIDDKVDFKFAEALYREMK